MTLEELDLWLDAYGRAWETHDVSATLALFTEDALYAWGPWGEPLRGHGEIAAAAERALSQQGEVRFGHEPLAITLDGRGLARWWVTIELPASAEVEENEGIFLVTLGPDRRCTDFREWWNTRTRPAADAAGS